MSVQDWARAAGLRTAAGGLLADTATDPATGAPTSLSQVAAGEPHGGLQLSAATSSETTAAGEALWAIGLPLHGAQAPLRSRALLVLLPLRFPEAVAGVRASAAAGRAHRSVLASGLAMAITDPTQPDDPLVWVSPSFEQLTGYSSQQVLGRICRFLQGPDTDPQTLQRLRVGIAADETTAVMLLKYRRDGSAFYNQLVVSPVFDTAGRLTHRVSVQSDVTGQVLVIGERDAALARAAQARSAQAAAEDGDRFRDHVHPLPPGSTLLLFTDGLIEHRGRSLDDGIADLRRVLSTCEGCTVQELLDRVVTELVGQTPDEDCAILAVRAHPEDRPRPPEAGPNRIA